MRSSAKTVEEYLQNLPEDKRTALIEVRKTILKNLPEGIQETMNWGMICYEIPLEIHPDTYNGQPLVYAGLAAQKNHMAVYLTNIYANEKLQNWFQTEYKNSGKKLNMGKSCIRFTKLENLPLELIGKAIAKTSMEEFIDFYEKIHKK
jgi:hypothetical protein